MHKQRVVVDAVRSDRALPLCPRRAALAGPGRLVPLVHRVVVFRRRSRTTAADRRRPRGAAGRRRRGGSGGVAQVGAFPVMVSRRDRNFGGLGAWMVCGERGPSTRRLRSLPKMTITRGGFT